MKKLSILIGTLFISYSSTTSLFSQFSVDMKSGFHVSNMESNLPEMINTEALVMPAVSLNVEYELDPLISIGTGLNLTKRGFVISQSTGIDVLGQSIPVGIKANTELSYMDIPAFLKFRFSSAKVEPYFSLGPVLSYARSGNINTKATALFDINMTNTSLNLSSEDYNRFQVHGAVNAGIRLPYGKSGHWILDLGYQHSFTDLVSDNFTADLGGKHKGTTVSLGYGIKF